MLESMLAVSLGLFSVLSIQYYTLQYATVILILTGFIITVLGNVQVRYIFAKQNPLSAEVIILSANVQSFIDCV